MPTFISLEEWYGGKYITGGFQAYLDDMGSLIKQLVQELLNKKDC